MDLVLDASLLADFPDSELKDRRRCCCWLGGGLTTSVLRNPAPEGVRGGFCGDMIVGGGRGGAATLGRSMLFIMAPSAATCAAGLGSENTSCGFSPQISTSPRSFPKTSADKDPLKLS
ncbi:MAG: hypothetical protein SGARI_002637, partial [Bacillariaceae sp.]